MKSFLARTLWIRSGILGVVLLLAGSGVPANGQVNSWTGAGSGNWEDSNWSLEVLPGTGQTILLTNAGFKAVAIGTNTAENFPQTLLVDSLTISSPTNSSNTLLLNYAGLKEPLSLNSLIVGSNSAVVMFGSALEVSDTMVIGGTFTEDASSVVTNWSLDVERVGGAGYNLNSGLLTSGAGEDIGFSLPSMFIQTGGTNHAVGLRIYTNSEYDLNGGLLDGVIILRENATFKQQGGTVDNSSSFDNITSIDGSFLQSGGMFIGSTNEGMYLPGYPFLHRTGISGVGLQMGGTNAQENLILGFQVPAENQDNGNNVPGDSGSYTLSNGVMVTSGTIIGGNGTMEQAGGTHTVNGSLSIQGALYYFNGVVNRSISGAYALDGGTLWASDISLGVAASFSQSSGTNHVAGGIVLTRSASSIGYFKHGLYSLNGGQLTASNILVLGGGLSQSGGQLIVSNNLQLADTTFQQMGGTMVQSGVLTLADASWNCAAGSQQAGGLQLGVSDAVSSSLNLSGAACIVHFGSSSSLVWSNQAVLNVNNWSGSLNGGGGQQIIFGNGPGALTAQQLSLIVFRNPSGLRAGMYPARILASGEIVPDTGGSPATIGIVNQLNGQLQITIHGLTGSNYAIQTSTDLLHWVPWTTQLDSMGTISLTDGITNGPARFYRTVLLP